MGTCNLNQVTDNQSHYTYLSRAMSNLYGTEIEIWARFGPVGKTEKKIMINF